MNREEFDKLELEQQIEYLNNQLKGGQTLRNICNDIGIARSTVRGRADKLGFEYREEDKQYIKIKEGVVITQKKVPSKATPSKNYKSNTEVIKGKDIIEVNSSKDNNYQSNDKVIDELQLKVEEMYAWYSKLKKSQDIAINKFEGEPLNRTYKIYPDVQEQFKSFCEQHKDHYRVQDLITQALYEFMEKYK